MAAKLGADVTRESCIGWTSALETPQRADPIPSKAADLETTPCLSSQPSEKQSPLIIKCSEAEENSPKDRSCNEQTRSEINSDNENGGITNVVSYETGEAEENSVSPKLGVKRNLLLNDKVRKASIKLRSQIFLICIS